MTEENFDVLARDDQEIKAALETAKPMHFGLAVFLSLPIAGLGFVISQTVRWSDHLAGFVNGLFHLVFMSLVWPIYMIPWCLAVWFSYRKRESKRHRTLWILGPAMILSFVVVVGLVIDPPSPEKRFVAFTKTRLPSNHTDLEAHFSGGGMADYGDTYYFKTTPSEIDRLIREMEMEEDKLFGNDETSYSVIKPLPGSPNFKTWKGARQYQWMDEKLHWFSYMITDAAKTQAYIFVGCT